MGKSNFSEQFRKLINCYKRIEYNPYVMRRTACLIFNQPRLIAMLHSLIARRRVGPHTQWRPRHKAFTSRLGLDAISLAWPAVVQLVVSFNSGLQWGISQEYPFFVLSQWSIWLRCIDCVRKPLCEPKFFMYFWLRIISGPIKPPGSVYYMHWPF